MKELSIEEKAKRYDEAIKRLEDIKTGKCQKTFMFTEGLFDYIFHELKESEDERIVKELLTFFREGMHGGHILTNKEYDSWIAWLEKQGKNNIGISEVTKQKLEDNLHKALEKETPESCNEFLEKQCEQKPVINMKTPEESLGIDSETYNEIVDDCIYGEQKPAWSEEDEKIYQSIIDDTVQENQLDDKQINWLKSLKDRVQPQPKWNYNDEIIIGTIIQEIEKISSEKFIDNAKYRCLDWLRYRTKSLRPQNTWKPSDGQMSALKEQCVCKKSTVAGALLCELFHDLEKLRDE